MTAWRKGNEPIERLAVHSDADATSFGDPTLAAALAGLPTRERQVAVLFNGSDLTVADIATRLGVGEGTVKTLLSRARAHLARQLQAESTGGVA